MLTESADGGRVTYTALTRAHHYAFATALDRARLLRQFVSGFPRLSPRGTAPVEKTKFRRADAFSTVFFLCQRLNGPKAITKTLARLATQELDRASRIAARESHIFIYYRTTGLQTARWLKVQACPTICIMEEVNSHVEECYDILRTEKLAITGTDSLARFYDQPERPLAYESADLIWCPSSFVFDSFLRRGVPAEKLVKVNYGFTAPTTADVERPRVSDEKFRILFVGQLHFRKGLRYLVEAFRNLDCDRKELHIVGPKTRHPSGLEGRPLPDGVFFHGIQKGEALASQFRTASVFVLPSIEEGLALVQGEALSYGLPLITTSNTGGSDLISDGVEGFIVMPRDAEAIREKLALLCAKNGLREKMAHAAKLRACKIGGWDRVVTQLLNEIQARICSRDFNVRESQR